MFSYSISYYRNTIATMSTVSATRRLLKLNPRLLQGRTNQRSNVAVSYTDLSHSLVGHKVLFSSCTQPLRTEERVTVHFVNRDGQVITASGRSGDSLLHVVESQKLDIAGFGACEGTLACSTCHLILDQEVYNQLGHIVDEELDMLDLAFGLTDTSRLGCQVCLSESLEGMTVRVPEGINDMRRSDDTGSSSNS